MSLIEGPWAFAFCHKSTNSLYFGRDPIGRRSLLASYAHGKLALSSAYVPNPPNLDIFQWTEVDTSGKPL